MDIKTMPKETLAELLLFLAENERFSSVEETLAEGLSVEEVRACLRELAEGLKREVSEGGERPYNPQKDAKLSNETKTIITYLSPGEEKLLLGAFGFIDKPKSALKNPSPYPNRSSLGETKRGK